MSYAMISFPYRIINCYRFLGIANISGNTYIIHKIWCYELYTILCVYVTSVGQNLHDIVVRYISIESMPQTINVYLHSMPPFWIWYEPNTESTDIHCAQMKYIIRIPTRYNDCWWRRDRKRLALFIFNRCIFFLFYYFFFFFFNRLLLVFGRSGVTSKKKKKHKSN